MKYWENIYLATHKCSCGSSAIENGVEAEGIKGTHLISSRGTGDDFCR